MVEQLTMFLAEIDAEQAKASAAERLETVRENLRMCWPEWEGPRVGGFCSCGDVCAEMEGGGETYAYGDRCRILEVRDGGLYLVEVQAWPRKGEERPYWKNGTRLVLREEQIWAPVDDLLAARLGAEEREEAVV